MARKTRNVDVVEVNLTFAPEETNPFSFYQILTHRDVVDKQILIKGKLIEFNQVYDTDDYFVGIVQTTQDKDIPPKRNKITGLYTPLNIAQDEGLGFGNVFLFEKRRNILLYEVNKNGCHLDQFRLFIYKCWNAGTNGSTKFNLNFGTVFRLNEYRRAMNMRYYKSLELKMANPDQVIRSIRDEDEDILSNIKSQFKEGIVSNSDIVNIKYEVFSRKPQGLSPRRISRLIEAIKSSFLDNQNRGNALICEVVGYSQNEQETRLQTANLLGDILRTEFKIDEPRIHFDVQISQRRDGIIEAYERILVELNNIFGSIR